MERSLKLGALLGAFYKSWRLGLIGLVLACGPLFTQSSLLDWADLQLHDWLTRSLPQRATTAPITLIDIDERSLADIGPWPWPRPVMARLVQALRERGAKLQVWDLFFADSAAGDERLAAALAARPDVVLGQVLVIDPKVHNPPHAGQLRATPQPPPLCSEQGPILGHLGVAAALQPAWVGHISATPDADGPLRRLPAVLCGPEQQHYPQLALASAAALAPAAPWVLTSGHFFSGPAQWLQRGDARFALDAQGYLPIPYAREHTALPAISAAQLLLPTSDIPSLQGQIVIIGSTALGLGDAVTTPRHPKAPGVSVHAELLGAALDGGWVTKPQSPATVSALMTFLVVMALLPLARPQRSLSTIFAYVLPALCVPLLVAVLGRLAFVMLPVAAPTAALLLFGIGVLVAKADAERRRAQQLALHLESFLPQRLAHEIAHQLPSGETLGKPCHGLLLAVRVQGLERWTNSVDSLQALAVAHAISTLAEGTARTHGGALEHVRGEVLLLAWPKVDSASTSAAIEAARTLLGELAPLLQQNASLRFPMGAQATLEAGAFLLGVAGPQASRRPLLLGPAADLALAMLPFCEELAAPLLVGPHAAQSGPQQRLIPMGQFLLPDHAQPLQLFRCEV